MKPFVLSLCVLLAAIAAIWMWPDPTGTRPDPEDPEFDSPTFASTTSGKNGDSQRTIGDIFESGEAPQLEDSQVEAFVESQNRNAPSLLAAWNITNDEAWLDEAAEAFPNDPQVAITLLSRRGIEDPEHRRWIEVLLKNDPDNAVGNLFAARAALESGDTLSALAELQAMGSKSRSEFYSESSLSTVVAAFRYSGFSKLKADLAGFSMAQVPSAEMAQLNSKLAESMTAAHLDGDDDLVRSLGEAGMDAAKNSADTKNNTFLITRLIGIKMQRDILHQLHEFQLVPGDDDLVIERLEALDEMTSQVKTLLNNSVDLLPTMTENEAQTFFDLVGSDGEITALEWLVKQRENR